jgi:hypothetical protein
MTWGKGDRASEVQLSHHLKSNEDKCVEIEHRCEEPLDLAFHRNSMLDFLNAVMVICRSDGPCERFVPNYQVFQTFS